MNKIKSLIILTATFLITSLGLFAQDKTGKKDTMQHMQYTCTMHPEVASDKPGKCPKCGMVLVAKKMYTCPMHPEVVSDKAGKCPKCGMDLVEKKAPAKGKMMKDTTGMKMK